MNDVEFMADLESVILRGSWPSTVGMVALNGCRRCTTILDCRRAVEVVASAVIHPSGAALSADMFCDKCFDEHVYPDIESGRLRQRVAKNLNRPLWAPPPDPETLPLPGVLSDEQPEGSVRVIVQVTDGRKIMGPEEEDSEPVPHAQGYVTWGGERHPVPSMGELESWVFGTANCEAVDGCTTDPDGTCCHGAPSWLIELGMI
jgi:hypothetical protein